MIFTREQLHERHRLSHQQIDRWLGESSGNRFLDEKIRQLEKVKKFLAVGEVLKQNGISFINFKGPSLSYRLYGDPTIRLSHDVDFLIHKEEIDKVVKILFNNGYRFSEGDFWPGKKTQQELLIQAAQHLSFYNPEINFAVEIHWVLLQILPLSHKKQKKIIADNLDEVEFGGQKHLVLAKELELLYLIIHGSSHGWERLKWLVDIHDYPIAKIDERKFYKLVNLFNAKRSVSQTNYMLKTFFEVQFPFCERVHLPNYLIKFAFQSIEGEIQTKKSFFKLLRKQRNYFLMFSRLQYKMRVIWGVFFRNRQEFLLTDLLYRLMYTFYFPYSFIKRRVLHAG